MQPSAILKFGTTVITLFTLTAVMLVACLPNTLEDDRRWVTVVGDAAYICTDSLPTDTGLGCSAEPGRADNRPADGPLIASMIDTLGGRSGELFVSATRHDDGWLVEGFRP